MDNHFQNCRYRYLRDEPVEACPPTLGYRLSKTVRRHKAALAVAAGFVALLIAGVVLSSWQAVRAMKAERVLASSEKAATQDRDAAKRAQRDAIREKNAALAAREELRQTLYASEMNLVQSAWESHQFGRVDQLLTEQPADLRGFEWHYWRRKLQHGRLRVVKIPDLATQSYGRLSAAAFSRSGERLAAILDMPNEPTRVNGFGLLAVIDSATGKPLFPPLDPFPGWTDDGYRQRLLTASKDGSLVALTIQARSYAREGNPDAELDRISLRDGATGQEVRSLKSPGFTQSISLSPNGSRLAASYVKNRERNAPRQPWLTVWDTSNGDEVQTLPMPGDGYGNLCWSPDGQRLVWNLYVVEPHESDPNSASASYHQQFAVIDVASGEELWRREVPKRILASAWTWSPNGKWVVVSHSRDEATPPNLQLWDSDTGQTLAIFDRNESSIRDATIDFSQDGRRLAVAAATKEIYIWDLPELSAAKSAPLHVGAPNLLLSHVGKDIVAVAFSANGNRLISAAVDSLVTWDATTREDAPLGPDSSSGILSMQTTRRLAISPDGTMVALGGSNTSRTYHVWDLARDQELWRLKDESRFWGVGALGFSADGKRIVLANRLGTPDALPEFTMYDAQTGHELGSIPLQHPAGSNSSVFFWYRSDGKQFAAFVSPYGDAKSPRSRSLMAWDAANHKLNFSVDLPIEELIAQIPLGYTRDGAALIVAFVDRTIPYSGRGESLRDSVIVFFDARTGQRMRSISFPPGLIPLRGAVSHNKILAIGRKANSVLGPQDARYSPADLIAFDLTTGQERLRVRNHDGFDHYTFSPDGSRLALAKTGLSTRSDSEVSIWSMQSGKRLLTLKRRGQSEDICFANDGNRLIGVFANDVNVPGKPIQVWDATPLPEETAK